MRAKALVYKACLVLGCTLVGIACSFDSAGLAGGDTAVDGGSHDAMPVCMASTSVCRDGDTLLVCRADGSSQDEQPCALGCADAPVPHCRAVVPSNGIPADPIALGDPGDPGDGMLDTASTGSVIFDSDSGRITTGDGTEVRPAVVGYHQASGIAFSVVSQSGGPSIGVFSLDGLVVESGTTLRGIGNNALGLVSGGTVTIAGLVDVTGGPDACPESPVVQDLVQCPGPGGNAGGRPESAAPGSGAGEPGVGGQSAGESGGGGGAHGAAGGGGGAGGISDSTTGGQAFGTPDLVPLTGGGGGSGGGNEPSNGNDGAAGGGGGGAIQIVARTAIVLDTGASEPCGINAGGGGGGIPDFSTGGGGGGAGGGILLEAPEVTLGADCVLAANGGGGSGGSGVQPGTTGLLDATAAAGSAGDALRNNGDGGAGGAAAATAGSAGVSAPVNEGGGGGGGAGILCVNTLGGDGFLAEGVVSPEPRSGALEVE